MISFYIDIIRQKEKEISELKTKVAQFFAVMPSVPNESFIGQCSSSGSSMLRLNDTAGPSSPLTHAHMNLCSSPLMNQLQSLSVYSSTSNSMSPQTPTSQVTSGANIQQQTPPQPQSQQQSQVNSSSSSDNASVYTRNDQQSQQQQSSQQQSQQGNSASSNLDPNATAYTPITS